MTKRAVLYLRVSTCSLELIPFQKLRMPERFRGATGRSRKSLIGTRRLAIKKDEHDQLVIAYRVMTD
jgi:hypothetical protein